MSSRLAGGQRARSRHNIRCRIRPDRLVRGSVGLSGEIVRDESQIDQRQGLTNQEDQRLIQKTRPLSGKGWDTLWVLADFDREMIILTL